MTEAEHQKVTQAIHRFKGKTGRFPTHAQILKFMLFYADSITYIDALSYGLGSTFRSRLSDLRSELEIESFSQNVKTRYGTTATIKAHRLLRKAGVAV